MTAPVETSKLKEWANALHNVACDPKLNLRHADPVRWEGMLAASLWLMRLADDPSRDPFRAYIDAPPGRSVTFAPER